MTISNEAVEGATLILHTFGGLSVPEARERARVVLEAAAPIIRDEAEAEALPIIRDLIDGDPCSFDHHGGCQAHGYLSLQPGETCPQHDAKAWLRERTHD